MEKTDPGKEEARESILVARAMACPLYLVESLGLPRNHHALFLQLGDCGNGHQFQVKGNISEGMTYEAKPIDSPEIDAGYISKTQLGWVSTETGEMCSRIDQICRSIPPPAKQFDGAKRIWPSQRLRRCQEWTLEVIQLLEELGVLQVRTKDTGGEHAPLSHSEALNSSLGESKSPRDDAE